MDIATTSKSEVKIIYDAVVSEILRNKVLRTPLDIVKENEAIRSWMQQNSITEDNLILVYSVILCMITFLASFVLSSCVFRTASGPKRKRKSAQSPIAANGEGVGDNHGMEHQETRTLPKAKPDVNGANNEGSIHLGAITLKQLEMYNGSVSYDGRVYPICISLRGVIYDVSRRPEMYGPDSAYGFMAGKDGSRALAEMSIDPDLANKPIDGLSQQQLDSLHTWETVRLHKIH